MGTRLGVARIGGGLLAGGGQRVETAAGSILVGRDLRIFPAALQQTHLLETSERAIERAVGRYLPQTICPCRQRRP